jgi:hypothetical protein
VPASASGRNVVTVLGLPGDDCGQFLQLKTSPGDGEGRTQGCAAGV